MHTINLYSTPADDNKMLTLASNERIPLKANMRMLFEIRDLNYASPGEYNY